MDRTALFSLSYGVFLLTAKDENRVNGCSTNTCMQVADSPARIAISVLNGNLTCELIKKSGVFALSILDQSTKFDLIQRFGLQSGRNVDKFAGLSEPFPTDENGLPYADKCSCAVLSARVVSAVDLGTHTLFVAELTDAKKLGGTAPLTYADYHARVKPKPAAAASKPEKRIVGWRCKICGYEVNEPTLPADYACPLCGHGPDDFEPIYEGD